MRSPCCRPSLTLKIAPILDPVNDSTDANPIQSLWTQVDGLRMNGRIGLNGDPMGQRRPILFLHGLGVSSRYMVPTMLEMAPRHRVYAPDLPGFGRSQKPRRAMNIFQLTDALIGWMQAWQLGKSVLVCNSMGCQVAIELAIRRPDLVDRLVLSGPTMEPRAASPFMQILRLARDSIHEKPSLWLVAGFDYVRAGPLRVLETLRLAIDDHVERKLARFRAQTLLVRGSHDPVASQAWLEEIGSNISGARLAVIPRTGHAVNYSTPKEFAALIREFIESGSVAE